MQGDFAKMQGKTVPTARKSQRIPRALSHLSLIPEQGEYDPLQGSKDLPFAERDKLWLTTCFNNFCNLPAYLRQTKKPPPG